MESRLRTPAFIYECYIEYIRPQDGEDPQIKYMFPKDYEFDEDTKKIVPTFVFPLKDCSTSAEEHFTFVLTNLLGKLRFGFCRYPAKGDVCMCFLSDLPWYKVFYRIMDKISDMQLDYQSEIVQPFLKSLRNHPIPNLNNESVMSIIPDIENTEQVFTFPLPNPRRLPEIPTDHNLTLFYPSLHHEVVLCLFANLIFERRIIVTSNSISMLSASVHAIAVILYPLFWQHIFIPITPPHLLDYCTAPMPFLMGVHSSMMEQVRRMPINDVVILDVDQNELETPYTEDLLQIPPHVTSQLKHTLKKSSSAYGDTMTRAFMHAMVALMGGYRSALKMREGESGVTFDEDSFIHSRPQMEEFLSQLLHFQHFQQFLNSRIDNLNLHQERDMFDEEVIVFDEEMKTGKFSSEQMKSAFKEVKGILKKHGKDAIRNTGTLTQKFFQGMINEKVGPGDYYGNIQSSPNLSGNKSSTMDSRMMTTGSPTQRPRAPPRVVPYARHIEGKRKLQESLQLQEKRLSLTDRHLISITPPEIPYRLNDSENTSLDSKESVEITSADVVTGNLIDIEDDIGSLTIPVIIRPLSDEGDTDSASIISSSSSGSIPITTNTWDVMKTENEDPPPPPIPPPRRKHVKTPDPTGPLIDTNTTPDYPNDSTSSTLPPTSTLPPNTTSLSSPSLPKHMNSTSTLPNSESIGYRPDLLDRNHGTQSPFDDFSSSIGEALIDTSRRFSDPRLADTMSNTGHDLFKDVDCTLTSHSSSVPSLHLNSSVGRDQGLTGMPSIPENTQTNDPWKPFVTSNFNVGGTSPQLRKPPPKPRPYSGGGIKLFSEMNASKPGAIMTPTPPPSSGSNNSSISPDPLANIFGSGGLHGYAMQTL